jgi:hypothetical protein
MVNPPLSRMVLGTVQLGLPYGRNRQEPVMSAEAAFEVLDAAWELGIHTFDTAEGYGQAATRLTEWLTSRGLRERASIVTKVKPEGLDTFEAGAAGAIRRFTGCASVTLLSHGACDAALWEILLSVCERFGATAGQSVYGEAEVRAAVHCRRIVRVQAPANVFDHGAFRGRGSSPVPLDLRSVYLQGVLLDEPEAADLRVRGGGALASAVRGAAATVGTDPAVLLGASVLRVAGPDGRIVVGVDRTDELGVLRAMAMVPERDVLEFEELLAGALPGPIPAGVLDPRTW